jgi:hypothetical protein
MYQPLVSLQKPVVVDPSLANFTGVRMLIRCVPGDYIDQSEAQTLCSNLRTLFRNQGAQAEIEIPNPRGSFRPSQSSTPPDLVVDISSRMLHQDDNVWLWVLAVSSCLIIPGVTEDTFATDVTIRDGTGALLASETLQGRFERYIGLSTWGVNEVMDLLVRSDAEKVTGDAAAKDFSRDFYGQLTQLAFNANMRSIVMRGFTADIPSPAGASPNLIMQQTTAGAGQLAPATAPPPPSGTPGQVGPQSAQRPSPPSTTPGAGTPGSAPPPPPLDPPVHVVAPDSPGGGTR